MNSCGPSQYLILTSIVSSLLIFTATEQNNSFPVAFSSKEKDGRGSAVVQTAIIWQGFHFQWLRRELGFETPHRLGSVASYISNVSGNCDPNQPANVGQNCSVVGTYHVQFSPGVSGDYAYPKVHYQSVASTDPSVISTSTGNSTFSFEDNSTADPVLHSNTTHNVNITLQLPKLLSSERYQLLLQGFEVDMHCIPTPDHPCNSNAIWAYYFNISLAQDCTIQDGRNAVVCPLYFGLGRGWTPSHGGGKSYNYRMAYNVTVFFTGVRYSVQSGITMHMHRIAQRAIITEAPLTGQGALANTSTAKQSALMGLREISWNLLETNGHQDRGRYLEELVFSLTQKQQQQQQHMTWRKDTEIGYTWTMGYRDPSLTTYRSNVQYSLAVAALVAPREYLLVSPTAVANGSVCMDNEDVFTFHCSKLGLKSRTYDTVNIHGMF